MEIDWDGLCLEHKGSANPYEVIQVLREGDKRLSCVVYMGYCDSIVQVAECGHLCILATWPWARCICCGCREIVNAGSICEICLIRNAKEKGKVKISGRWNVRERASSARSVLRYLYVKCRAKGKDIF